MTDKQAAIQLIEKMSEQASLDDIMAELHFRQKVDRGLRDLAQGRIISHQDAKRRIAQRATAL